MIALPRLTQTVEDKSEYQMWHPPQTAKIAEEKSQKVFNNIAMANLKYFFNRNFQ